ncbi:MAG: hypothetical protein EOO61_14895 [Hymenobacter sp.]|nr:MAG: hypothetical protein EOO61_14895 [Hymenobacter sp.]
MFQESALELADAGFLGFPAAHQLKKTLVKEVPPVPGARLGKDKNGNPAWFIADPEHQHQFLQVKQNDLV